MKKFLSIVALLGIIAASNCTGIPENDDPILGIWVRSEWVDSAQGKSRSLVKKEWIFNDVYLGRYQEYLNHQLVYYTDFSWESGSQGYILTYYGTDAPPVELLLNEAEDTDRLEYLAGGIFAEREEDEDLP